MKDKEYLRKKEVVTSFFSNNRYGTFKIKNIIKKLKVPDEEKEDLKNILNELYKEGIICYYDDTKRYVYAKSLIICKYSSKSTKFGFGVALDGEEIHISSLNNEICAMNGDDILVRVISKSNDPSKKSEGEVVKILSRNTKKVIGRLEEYYGKYYVIPIDASMGKIKISSGSATMVADGDFVEVEITKYPGSYNNTEGKITRIIGKSNDERSYVQALCLSYNLDELENFNSLVMSEIEKIPDSVEDDELVGRIDRTGDRVYTIDAEDAMDLDDAVGIKKLSNGNYMLSVYIADVSHYVKDGTNLDKEAIARGTSIYIPGTVIPMLPKKLSNGICSLNAGEKRLALGVDMEISPLGKVLSNNIFKAVIKVEKKMSYDKVYKVLTNEDETVLEEYSAYKNDIFLMKELAEILNKKRMEEGSINFDIPETKVVLDKDGRVVDIKPYEITFANSIVEEFMLVTNQTVAEKFYFLGVPFIYRVHEKPDEEKLQALNEILAMYKKRIKSIKNINPKVLSGVLQEFKDENDKRVISDFALRTLKLAKYSSECTGHFGLAIKYYCHFTSPIRRYPDLFIHRVISKCLDNNYELSQEDRNKYLKQAEMYSKSSSEAEKQATTIERDFDDLYMAIYMSRFIGKCFDATVSSVTSFGIFVCLDNTVEGLVSFNNIMDADYYIFDEKKHILIGERTGKIFKVGDKVRVKLVKTDIRLKQIDFILL